MYLAQLLWCREVDICKLSSVNVLAGVTSAASADGLTSSLSQLTNAEQEQHLGPKDSYLRTSCDLVLEADGWQFPCHRVQLKRETCFSKELDRNEAAPSLQLAGQHCNKSNVLLLLCTIYSFCPQSFMDTCELKHLKGLAELCASQQYRMDWVLKRVDHALVVRAGGKLESAGGTSALHHIVSTESNVENAMEWAFWADRLQLKQFSLFMGNWLGKSANHLNLLKFTGCAEADSTAQVWLATMMEMSTVARSAGAHKMRRYCWDPVCKRWSS